MYDNVCLYPADTIIQFYAIILLRSWYKMVKNILFKKKESINLNLFL